MLPEVWTQKVNYADHYKEVNTFFNKCGINYAKTHEIHAIDNELLLLGAFTDDKLIGILGFGIRYDKHDKEEEVSISCLFVKKKFRRMGICTALLKRCEEFFVHHLEINELAHGCMLIKAAYGNRVAIAAYKRYGFSYCSSDRLYDLFAKDVPNNNYVKK